MLSYLLMAKDIPRYLIMTDNMPRAARIKDDQYIPSTTGNNDHAQKGKRQPMHPTRFERK